MYGDLIGFLGILKGIKECKDCIFEDCHEYWEFCPYTGRKIREMKKDAEILADAEVIS